MEIRLLEENLMSVKVACMTDKERNCCCSKVVAATGLFAGNKKNSQI